MSSDHPTQDELVTRARRLVEDLNMTTLGWQMPSDRIIEDFAGGEHRLLAREHELTDLDPTGARGESRRAFTLYAPDAGQDAEPVALLIEPTEQGRWHLLVTDSPAGGRVAG
jgi:hypothetical protein